MAWTLIRGGTVVDGTGSPPFQADVCIRDGVIDAVGPDLSAPEGAQVMDAAGKLITLDLSTCTPIPIAPPPCTPIWRARWVRALPRNLPDIAAWGSPQYSIVGSTCSQRKRHSPRSCLSRLGVLTHTTPISFPLSGCGSPLPRPTVRSWTGLLMASSWSICAEWGWAPTWLWWPGRPRSAYRPWAPTTIGTPLRRRSPPWRAPSARPWMAARWD